MSVSKLNAAVSMCATLLFFSARGVEAEELVCLSTTGIGFQSIVGVDTESPQLPTFVKPISGVEEGMLLNGLDFRASDRQLYAIASPSVVNLESPITRSQLYTIDVDTGVATPVGGPIVPGATVDNLEIPTRFGFDFNPSVDLIRVISNMNENIVVDPDTGLLVIAAQDVAYASDDVNAGVDPNIVHIAYDNNVAGAATTQQFGIDTNTRSLVTVANNAGTLVTVAKLDIGGPLSELNANGGFDVSGESSKAYTIVTVRRLGRLGLPFSLEEQVLYTIDTKTGKTKKLGRFLPGLLGTLGQVDGLTVVTSNRTAS